MNLRYTRTYHMSTSTTLIDCGNMADMVDMVDMADLTASLKRIRIGVARSTSLHKKICKNMASTAWRHRNKARLQVGLKRCKAILHPPHGLTEMRSNVDHSSQAIRRRLRGRHVAGPLLRRLPSRVPEGSRRGRGHPHAHEELLVPHPRPRPIDICCMFAFKLIMTV